MTEFQKDPDRYDGLLFGSSRSAVISMRRALSIFRNEVHGKTFSIAAAHDRKQLGPRC